MTTCTSSRCFHSMKSDIVHGIRFDEDYEIASIVGNGARFYNDTRIHSSLGYVSPGGVRATVALTTQCQQHRGRFRLRPADRAETNAEVLSSAATQWYRNGSVVLR
jgi:hypothetical protein